MKAFLGILLVVGVIVGAWKIFDYWEQVKKEKVATQKEEESLSTMSFEGMPTQLESSLQKAQANGPQSFKQWIEMYRPLVKDPRLGAIELDYVLAIARENPVEAKRIFLQVKTRIPTNAPLYRRIKSLEKNYD